MSGPAYEVSRLASTVYFSLTGDRLDPTEVSATLGVEPTSSRQVGDIGESGEPHSQALWLLESPLPAEGGLESHLNWLRHVLSPHYDFIKSIMGSAEGRFFCDIRTERDQCGFEVSPEVLSMFVELGVPLEGAVHF